MNSWFLKNLGDPLLANPALAEIEDLFIAGYKAVGGPDDRAIFMRHESEGRLHCDVVVYLSPPLYALAAELDAQPCRPPVINGLSLLVGSERAWPLLFPEFIP
ncbi:hypothetical protein [Dasania marina]|uniref:hypothetical protein n=1 Tax=Dasania marina TaxID=471499 RepID=UPI0030D9100E|tara:strand:+ start:4474 stop:4782 length:309 start_codon:yes stop_codon:yes gene_type:complete